MTPRGGDTASFLNALRDPKRVKRLLGAIKEVTAEPVAIMEVCGGHTRTIVRYGLEQLLPKEISFLHGPGCPVCVTPRERVDMAVALAHKKGLVLATLGDMLRVPGSSGSLLQARASGCDIRVVYSPLDVLALAKQNPKKTVVFFAIGFETTAPTTAALLERCLTEGVPNVKVLVNHVLVAPAIEALLLKRTAAGSVPSSPRGTSARSRAPHPSSRWLLPTKSRSWSAGSSHGIFFLAFIACWAWLPIKKRA